MPQNLPGHIHWINIKDRIMSLVKSAIAQVAKRVGLDSGFLKKEQLSFLDLLNIENILRGLYYFQANRLSFFPSNFLFSTSLNCALTHNVFTSTEACHGGQGEGPQNQSSVQDHPLLKVDSAVAVLSCRAMMRAELRRNFEDTQTILCQVRLRPIRKIPFDDSSVTR